MSTIILTLDVSSLLYIILLLVVYFSKKRIKSFETTIFGLLIPVAIIGIFTEFIQLFLSSISYDKYQYIIDISAYIYIYTYFIIYLVLTSFAIIKSYTLKENDINKVNKFKNKVLLINFIISLVLIIITILTSEFLDYGEAVVEEDSYYGDGISIIFIITLAILMCTYMFISLVKNFKKFNNKEKIFYISIILLQGISGVVRFILPEFMMNNMINAFMIAIMFFTIENPDIKLITDLREANDAKNSFLSSMSHEMKTPLNTIIGLSTVGETKEDFNDINKEANILLDIVNNVMDSNSFDVEKVRYFKETFNIKNSLSSVIDETKNSIADKPILFTSNIPDMMIISNGDAIVSICDRLLSNSYKFTEKGFISFNITIDNNKLIIDLKDSGKGIPNDQLVNIYDKFNRKKEDVEGTILGLGLGLSLVKLTVDALYGTIDIKSVVDEGTEVIVTLPIEKGK